MKKYLLILGLSFYVFSVMSQIQPGTWGDQNNGYYRNPILNSNFPDNDVIFVNNEYYMITSTNNYIPAMTILKSKDLVNWEYSNSIVPESFRLDSNLTLTPDSLSDSCGTWAGSIGYNGKYYYVYWCYNKMNLTKKESTGWTHVYSKSKSIEGPWSEPKELTFPDGTPIGTTDPGVLFDLEKKEAWYVIPPGIIYRLSWDGDRLLQNKEDGLIMFGEYPGEANKLYKFGDWYYEMNAHVRIHEGERQRMQAIHRSKSILGPWEGRLCMENGNGTKRSPSQGTLLQIPDGSWWYIHQLAWGDKFERYNGRPQFLEPVEWKNGWPLIGVDTDNDGIGEVVWYHKKPISVQSTSFLTTDDDFDSSELSPQWMWRYNPLPSRWSLTERPGFLRLKSCVSVPRRGASDNQENLLRLPNMLCQRVLGTNRHLMTAKFELDGMTDGMEAGFHLSSKHSVAIGVKKNDGSMRLFKRDEISQPFKINIQKGEIINQSTVWFRCLVENGMVTMYYSLDGIHFNRLGNETRASFDHFTPSMIGFYAKNSVEDGYVDIDNFDYDYDGPRIIK